MVLTKQYLRYVPAGVCNIIGSSNSNVVYLSDKKICLVGACENVYAWNIKREEKVCIFPGENKLVVVVRPSHDGRHLAVGYADGVVKIFDFQEPDSPKLIFSGHKSSVTCLQYSDDGLLLVSGGKDCVIILWDIVNESGLFRLTGHQGPITQCRFVRNGSCLMSSSKDSLIKVWDLSSQHCVYTLVEHRSEVWDFVFIRNETQLITGSIENELRLFDIEWLEDTVLIGKDLNEMNDLNKKSRLTDSENNEIDEKDQENSVLRCKKFGTVFRQARGRVTQLIVSSDEKLLLSLGTGMVIDAYKIYSQEETKLRIRKKLRKLAKKSVDADSGKVEENENSVTKDVSTRIVRIGEYRCSAKPKSVDMITNYQQKSSDYQVLILLQNNYVEEISLAVNDRTLTYANSCKIFSHGHRTDIRTLTFSNDDTAFLSASQDSVKVWNRNSVSCIRTMPCDNGLSALFVPGDRHCVVGTKQGKLVLYDIGSNEIIETIDAHGGPVWSVCLSPDQKSLISGSADKLVKFWDFELISDDNAEKKRLSLVHVRTLQLTEDVLCCKLTSSYKFLAIGLLDNTAKIYFVDSLKFFLCLYGHSLPVLCLDISSDDTLIITGSADKNVKIWGMDFGDCHKSLFAHDDSVTSVQFVPKTHLFFSIGKDGKVKQWDADKFEKVFVLSDHHNEIWALSVSSNGRFCATASHDKSIRLWEKSEEILVLQEEQEIEREVEYEKSLEQQTDVVPGESAETEAGLASKKTLATVKSAEDIIEALDICRQETDAKLSEDYHKHQTHPIIKAYGSTTLATFLMDVIRKLRSSELEKALLMIPFGYVVEMLEYLEECIRCNYEIELGCRCVLFLMKIHYGVLLNSSKALPIIDKLKDVCVPKLNEIRDLVGFNIAALKFLQLELIDKERVQMFVEAKEKVKQKRKKQKSKLDQAYILT